MSKKLARHELEVIKTNIEMCLKAINRALAYDEEPEDRSFRDSEDEVYTILKEVHSKVYSIPNFDTTFVDSLMDSYSKYHKLTEKQQSALENLHRKLCQRK